MTDGLPNRRESEFRQWYEAIRRNADAKQALVVEEPETALRMFSIFRDKDIGRRFVNAHAGNKEHHDSAYFVSVEMGKPIVRAKGEVRALSGKLPNYSPVLSAEDRETLHFCGNLSPEDLSRNGGNYWMDNHWDNVVRAQEER